MIEFSNGLIIFVNHIVSVSSLGRDDLDRLYYRVNLFDGWYVNVFNDNDKVNDTINPVMPRNIFVDALKRSFGL